MMRAAAVGLVVLGAFMVGARVAAAQQSDGRQALFPATRFAPPGAAVDFARHYPYLEDCHAALERVRRMARWGDSVLSVDPARFEPPAVVETARECWGDRFRVTAVEPPDLPLLRELAHYAERDSAGDDVAQRVLDRELALLPADATVEARAEVLMHAAQFALSGAQPARVHWAERQLSAIDSLGEEARIPGVWTQVQLLGYAAGMYDTVRIDRYAGAIFSVLDSLPPDARELPTVKFAERILHQVHRMRMLARGEVVPPLDSTPLPPIAADFWFRRADSTAPRSTPGRGGLVVFVDAECLPSLCYDRYALLRALHERLGDALEITLVEHTHGYFRNYPPLTPAEEAERLRDFYFEHLQLPGALAVETTEFTRLPDPDGRRVDRTPANVAAYRPANMLSPKGVPEFGLPFPPSLAHRIGAGVSGFLVDGEGRALLVLGSMGIGADRLVMAALEGWLARTGTRVSAMPTVCRGEGSVSCLP